MARCTPLSVLKRIVRSEFVPEHYPNSMARMYAWSPDECIPEFYTDINVFTSIHTTIPKLPDIELPAFAPTPEAFIAFHRSMLESDYVSSHVILLSLLIFCCHPHTLSFSSYEYFFQAASLD